ncbi:serine/threonine/tyrosine-interacting-like protein 2 [Periophthalmus magnuspinnatus]|uniref:serine/threonine/tyrosine-interacting-like protein 2 n=1 Tax=Periophthalmus magnuspinnatus TaxID=409849 RepID=UPI0024366426|nr:serine/threonine/tyrosine-interacting-like protein 2 [Periophthalmus magnuspinnatus]
MASSNQSKDQTVPTDDDEEAREIHEVQSKYLRCPSPNFSLMSESRFSMISGSEADSIFMEPIHLSSAIAAKKIINEELPSRGIPTFSLPDSYLEPAEQLMVEDLYERVKELTDERSPYNTPCVLDLQRALVGERLEAPTNAVDEVWPNIYIAEKSVAVNKARLKRMGITHVLNVAHGTGVYTGATFYTGMGVQYLGIEVDDFPDCDIAQHFRTTAEFMDEALLTHKGKILVNSMMGISRSAILVASYLMIFQNMSILEALTAIRKKRPINPNEGFIKQLRDLNETLMEERDDDDDTLSQCSVIDAKTRAQIFGESYTEEEEEFEDGQSMAEAKAHSIMMDEEEDGASVMSSIPSLASSAAAEALRNGLIPKPGVSNNEDVKEKLVLPQDGDEEDFDDDEGLDSIIREWQRRNEKYQNADWFEAQLNSDTEDDLDDKLVNKKSKGTDLESVTSEDVRSVKEKLKRRMRQKDELSVASSCSSYSDLWKQRLKEIEEQAAARYRKKEEKGEEEKKEQGASKRIDDEIESLMSDTTSMYNFCQKNKESMTPLERWRVKRIQFGWNKKDREDGEKSSIVSGEEGDEETPKKRLEDVNLTAYQSWKLRQQKRLGLDENNDDLLEFSRTEESAKSAKRRQRREEILERSKKNLEESQSICGWETESCVSGGTIPLSAFWAGVTAPPSVQNNDDNISMISGRSSNISSVSQARSVKSVQSNAPPIIPPILPVPTVQGPSGEPMVNLASIQNWIANVVTETIKQKTTEMSLPPSRAGSEVSYRGGAAASILSGQRMEFDKTSVLSGASGGVSYLGANRAKPDSVISGASGASRLTGQGSILGSTLGSSYESSLGTKKKKITTTSVPLFSLFQDEVDLKKLDAIDKDIKSEMREKMDKYEKKKILEDNRRSTLYKKKKPKGEDEDEEEEEERKRREEEFLQEAKKKDKPVRSFGQSGCLNLNPALEKEKNTSIDDWLKSVRPPPRKTQEEIDDLYDDLDASASEFGYPTSRQDSEDEQDSYGSRYRPRFGDNDGDFSRNSERGGFETRERRREAIAEEEEDDISSFIAQTRQRIRARAMAETEDDEVLKAWREQQEAKANRTGGSED